MKVIFMVFCSKCGEGLPECIFLSQMWCEDYKRLEAGVSTPWKELKDSLSKMGQEMEKAFRKAREEIKEATIRKLIVCSNCGEKNFADAQSCYKCGKKLD